MDDSEAAHHFTVTNLIPRRNLCATAVACWSGLVTLTDRTVQHSGVLDHRAV